VTYEKRLVDLHDAAAYLGVSFWTVRDYVLAGYIPVMDLPANRPREGARPRKKPLRRVLIDRKDLDAFVESRKSRTAVNTLSQLESIGNRSSSARDSESFAR
jgi:predicted site-specific integrase-resolvase